MSQTVRPHMLRLMAVAVLATCLCVLALAFAPSGSVAAPQAAHAASNAAVHKALLKKMKSLPAWGNELAYMPVDANGSSPF